MGERAYLTLEPMSLGDFNRKTGKEITELTEVMKDIAEEAGIHDVRLPLVEGRIIIQVFEVSYRVASQGHSGQALLYQRRPFVQGYGEYGVDLYVMKMKPAGNFVYLTWPSKQRRWARRIFRETEEDLNG